MRYFIHRVIHTLIHRLSTAPDTVGVSSPRHIENTRKHTETHADTTQHKHTRHKWQIEYSTLLPCVFRKGKVFMESKLDRIIQLLELIVVMLDGEQEADQSQRAVRTLDGELIATHGNEETLG